ncbi:hypothetical protein OF83DRAFT_1088653 [Amylostereum chailletii]|nr:hypothetical protein OF83DRAFT_1088653 [Amylostereum chailletii]
MASNTQGRLASITATWNKDAPTLNNDGVFTIAVLDDFEEECCCLFHNLGIFSRPELQVVELLSSFQNPRIRNWICANEIEIIDYSFATFMAAIRVRLLGPTWAFDMQQQIHRL